MFAPPIASSRHLARFLAVGSIALCCFAWPGHPQADAVVPSTAMKSSTIAEIHVENGGIRTEIEVGAEDLPVFQDLLPDSAYEALGNAPRRHQDRIEAFLSEDWTYATDAGPLPGRLVLVEKRPRIARSEVDGAPLNDQPEGQPPTVLFVLEHDLSGSPGTLTISPPLNESAMARANIGFQLHHMGTTVNDFRYLSQAEDLELDWQDPWYSRFANPILLRHYRDPMSAFVSLSPFEIRKQAVLRLKNLEPWLGDQLKGREEITSEERERVLGLVQEFLADRLPMSANGKPLHLEFEGIDFLERKLSGTQPVPPGQAIPYRGAIVGVGYVAPTASRAREATLTWDLFSERVQSVAIVFYDESSGPPWRATPDDPVLRWQNFLVDKSTPNVSAIAEGGRRSILLPGLSLGLLLAAGATAGLAAAKQGTRRRLSLLAAAGLLLSAVLARNAAIVTLPNPFSAPPSSEEISEIVLGTARNLHLAQRLRIEADIDSAIGAIAAEGAADDIQLEVSSSLAVSAQGGGAAEVDEIEIEEIRVLKSPENDEFSVSAVWTGRARAWHWGHPHSRKLRFSSVMDFRPEGGFWKLSGLTVTRISEDA